MIVVIKGKQYDSPNFKVENGIATLKIHSEASFAEISEDFALEAGDSIIQLNDNEEQIGEYYVEGMASIQLPGEDGSDVVTIKYHVTQIGKDAQEALNDDLDETSMSVLELASMLSQAKRSFNDKVDEMESWRGDYNTRIETVERTQNTVNQSVATLESLFNTLADRVAVLENRNL